jgi:hypothetical protein
MSRFRTRLEGLDFNQLKRFCVTVECLRYGLLGGLLEHKKKSSVDRYENDDRQ